jgi:hypothetical protein
MAPACRQAGSALTNNSFSEVAQWQSASLLTRMLSVRVRPSEPKEIDHRMMVFFFWHWVREESNTSPRSHEKKSPFGGHFFIVFKRMAGIKIKM